MKLNLIFNLFVLIFILIETVCSFSLFGRSASSSNDKIKIDDKNDFTPAPKIKSVKLTDKCDPCPKGIKCVPYIQCPAHVTMKHKHPQMCELKGGKHGLCCTTGQKHRDKLPEKKGVLRDDSSNEVSPILIRSIIKEARQELAGILKHEDLSSDKIQRGEPEFIHNMVFRSRPYDVMKTIALSNYAMEEVLASRLLKIKEKFSNEDFEYEHVNVGFKGTPLENSCEKKINCPPHPMKYRSDDGSCNNPSPDKFIWGASGYPMQRLLPPAYEDGIWAPRVTSIDGHELTSPREISRILLPDVDRPHNHLNLLVMQFGQFLSHDVTQSASITLGDGKAVSCCTEDESSVLPNDMMHFACLPIKVNPDDPFYSKFNKGCINFVRSSLAPQEQCKMGYAKQLSKVTHFLDGSMIYGSDSTAQAELREFRFGRLQMMFDFGRELLPKAKEKDACLTMEKGSGCFFAGDGRVNQIITLTALHTLFAREHNRIAEILGNLNPHWSDDILFEETKRIVVAEYQVIIYKEWLPLIIGAEAMNKFDLHIQNHGYSTDYDEHINPAITNEFSTAAFRFGHSTVDGKLIVHRNHKIDEVIDIPEVMFNPARLRQLHFLDETFNTLMNQPMQQVDSSITKGLSRYLFRNGNPFGLDLAAINIQRGRDHGLRPYNDYLDVSGRLKIQNFHEFGNENGAKLSSVYKHPDDIDLWIGGLFETAKEDSVVGPTFIDIIADQFSRFRRGDRYFFEHSPEINPGHFTQQQLNEIRLVTMSRLICDNADHIALFEISPNAFIHGTSKIHCSDNTISSLNLLPWKE